MMINHSKNFYLIRGFAAALACTAIVVSSPSFLNAQNAYRIVPITVYEKKPVTVTRWVDETVSEKQTVTSYKPMWQTETRQRTQTTYKPVQETAERLEKIVLRKPVVETLMRTVKREETTHETVTRYRDEEYTVREPVIETQMRTEEYKVSKPVTKRLIEVKKTTTYKPVVSSETLLVPTEIPVIQMGARPDPNAPPRMQMLRPGYYTDPVSGATVYRKRGLHWVQPTIEDRMTSGTIPALIPQQYGKLAYVPETKEERKPIEITRYVDEVKTRKVPVEIQKMVERTKTRRVPYEVKIPKTVVTTEEVPYTRTTYKEETITKRVPYTRTRLQKVVTTEPYEVQVPKWISVTKDIEVPKTVARKVQKTYMQDVPKTVMMKVPLDICGNPIGPPQPLNTTQSAYVVPAKKETSSQSDLSIGTGTTLNAPLATVETGIGSSVVEKSDVSPTVTRNYRGELVERPAKTLDETAKSVLKSDENSSTKSQPKSSLKEVTPTLKDRKDGGPRTSDWQTEDPFGEYDFTESSTPRAKTLVETSGRQSVEDADATESPSEPEVNYEELLESPSKPDTDVVPSSTGNEKAADVSPPA